MVAINGSALGRMGGIAPTRQPTDDFWDAHWEAVSKAQADWVNANAKPAPAPQPPAQDPGNVGQTGYGMANMGLLPRRPAPAAQPGVTANPTGTIDNAAKQIGDAATKHQSRIDAIYADLNKLTNPWDTQGETYKAALGRALDDVTRDWAGTTQRTMDTLAQRGQGGGVGASIAAATMARQGQQALSDARSGMATQALQGTADFEMRKADALSRLSGGDLSGAQGAFGALAQLGVTWDGQKFGQKMAQAGEDRTAMLFGLNQRDLAARVGMSEIQLQEQMAGMPARLQQLGQAAAAGDLTLAQAKVKFPFEIAMLENQARMSGMQIDEATWATENKWLIMAMNLAGSFLGGGAGGPIAKAGLSAMGVK